MSSSNAVASKNPFFILNKFWRKSTKKRAPNLQAEYYFSFPFNILLRAHFTAGL